MLRPRARVYIDGFNLYYGALKGTPSKWLDLEQWCDRLLPTFLVEKIIYCTAPVVARSYDPDANVRQDVYLRALATLSRVEVVKGKFNVTSTRMPRVPLATCDCCQRTRAACACCHGPTVKVEKTEEKGSDVNVAVRLVRDGFRDLYDAALVVSNDSDIQPAVDIVRGELNKRVIVADPRNHKFPSLLGDERRTVRAAPLAASQLPTSFIDGDGHSIFRPAKW